MKNKDVSTVVFHFFIAALSDAFVCFMCMTFQSIIIKETLHLLSETCPLNLPDWMPIVLVFALRTDIAVATTYPVAVVIAHKVLCCCGPIAEVTF